MRQVLSTAASTVVNVDQWMHGQRIAVGCTVSSVVCVCILRPRSACASDVPHEARTNGCDSVALQSDSLSPASRVVWRGHTHVDHIGAGAAAAGNMRMLHVVAPPVMPIRVVGPGTARWAEADISHPLDAAECGCALGRGALWRARYGISLAICFSIVRCRWMSTGKTEWPTARWVGRQVDR